MNARRPQPRRGWIALRDLLLISLAVLALLWLGSSTGTFERAWRWVARQQPGVRDEIVSAVALVALGLMVFALRLWRSVVRESRARADAEGRFRALVEKMPAVTYIWDPRQPFGSAATPYISPQVESILGYHPERWMADPNLWIDRIHPDDRERVLEASERADRTGEPLMIDYRHRRPDGEVLWIREEAVTVERDAEGRPSMVQGLMYDVSDRKRAEQHLAEAEARYRTLVERVPAVTYLWDATYKSGEAPALYISPQVRHLLGYGQDEFGDPTLWSRIVHPDDLNRVMAEWSACERGDVAFRSEYRMRTSDGRLVWVRDEAVPIGRDDQGHPMFQGVMFDITDRKAAEERVRAAETRYRSLVEHMPVVAYLTDDVSDPPERYIAPGVDRLLGYTQGEWIADPHIWASVLHPDDRRRVLEESAHANRTGEPFRSEYRMIAKDGTVVWVLDDARVVERDEERGVNVWQGVLVDVSARAEAEQRLREAESTYRTLVEQLPVVVYQDAIDDTSTAIYISPQYERMFGYPPEARLKDPSFWINHLHPDDRERVVEESQRTNATGDPFMCEYRFLGRDGRVVWVRDEAVLLHDSAGEPKLWQGVLIDITQRRLAEETLSRRDAVLDAVGFAAERFLKSHDWQRTLPEVLERLGFAAGASRVYVFRNETLEDGRLAMSLESEWLAEGIASIEHAGSRGLAYADGFVRWEAALSSGHEIHGSVRDLPAQEQRGLEGEDVLSLVVVPVFVGDEWWGFLGFDDCVTERDWPAAEIEALKTAADTLGAVIGRTHAEAMRTEAEQRYRTLVETIPAVTYIQGTEPGDRVYYVSPQVEQLLGFTQEAYLNEVNLMRDLVHPDDRAWIAEAYRDSLESREGWTVEYRIVRPDGRLVWIRDESAVLLGDDGEPMLVQGVMSDVTERKLAEEALQSSERREREAAERLRALDDMKNTFLAAVSHELRSPLTSILGLALTLEQQDLPREDSRDLTGRLAQNARKLDRLLRDLLDIDRLSRGIVTPSLRETDVGELARRTVESLDVSSDRRIEIEVDEVVVPVDPAKVERIVENLVMNAVRHTAAEVTIWVRVVADPAGALLAVEDDGSGVPAELRDAIFEPFRQGPTASPHSPGTGIGLSLVAMFTELHGGRAWVEERPGGGASFRVLLPAPAHARLAGTRANGETSAADGAVDAAVAR